YMSVENFKDPFKVIRGMMQSWKIIGKKKPQVIFSKGGFVSVPVVFAARMRRVPTIIHEFDIRQGIANELSVTCIMIVLLTITHKYNITQCITNKLAFPFANQVLTTFPETVDHMPEKKVEHVGAIIRDELFQGDQTKGFARTGLTNDKPILLIMGGSSGSEKINDVVRNSLDSLLQDFQIIHICGRGHVEETSIREGYVQYEYVRDELKDIFAITD